MKIIECPNCYTRVALSDDGTCPACNKSPMAETADSTRTKITIREGQPLPPVCFGCARHTDALVTIRRADSTGLWRWCRIVLGIVILPVLVFTPGHGVAVFHSLFRARRVMKLKIPVCNSCRSQNLPREGWIDLPEGKMSFIVPKEVAREIVQAKED